MKKILTFDDWDMLHDDRGFPEWEETHQFPFSPKVYSTRLPTGEDLSIRESDIGAKYIIKLDDLWLLGAYPKEQVLKEAYKFYVRELIRKQIITQREINPDYYSLEEHFWLETEWNISKNGNFSKHIDRRYYTVKKENTYFLALFSGIPLKDEYEFKTFPEADEACFLDYLERISIGQLKPNLKRISESKEK
ncbi:MAG: hypothetical protein V9H25_06540 [Candidatus Competibacter sp.]